MWALWLLIVVLACSAIWSAFDHFADDIIALLNERF